MNLCIVFAVMNIVCHCLQAAKGDWDSQRVAGKPHPSGKSFKEIGWTTMWTLAVQAVQAAEKGGGLEAADAKHVKDTIEILQSALPSVDRFYPVTLEPREK